MFDYSVEGLAALTGADLAVAISSNHTVQVQAENRTLLAAAAWADLHSIDPDQPNGPLIERATIIGGPGTPEIGEFCCLEFGALLGVGMVAGRALIADALDVRHRLPRLWDRVRDGQVRAWKARKIAEATRHLPWSAAAEVDQAVAGLVETLPWPRFGKVLAAAIVDGDPALAAEREAQARTRRGVWATASEDGLKTIIARAATGDAVVFLATVNRIADILKADDSRCGRAADTADGRRARAVGILAQPARALALLLDHRTDPDPHEHSEPEPEPEPDPEQEPDRSSTGPDHDRDSSGLWLPELPADLDPAKLAPRIVLHYHLSDLAIRDQHGLARPGDHGDPISIQALRDWLTGTGCIVQVRPILDPADVPAVDRYEIPMRLRAALAVRDIADVFPYGNLSRRIDIDHTNPYDSNGPPGQTGLGNAGPLSRFPHRAATIGDWRKRQPDPGTYLWRSCHGWIWIVTNQGTLNLGNTAYSQAIWRAAKPGAVPDAFIRPATA